MGILIMLAAIWFFLPRSRFSAFLGGFLLATGFRGVLKAFFYGFLAIFAAAACTLGPAKTLQFLGEFLAEIHF